MDLRVISVDSGKDSKYFVTLLKSILDDFQGLDEKYQNLALILANRDKLQDGTIIEKLRQFFSVEKLKIFSMEKVASSGSIGKKGYLLIVLNEFSLLPEWEQQFALKHECGHLLLHSSVPSHTVKKLLEIGCPVGFLSKMRNAQHDYQVHKLMLEKYPNDWFKKPVRISENAGSPRKFFRTQKKKFGLKQALFDAVWNSFNLIRLIYLNQFIISEFKNTEAFTIDLQRYETQLTSFWKCIQKETNRQLPSPKDWIKIDDLQDEETFFTRVQYLLVLIKEVNLVKQTLERKVGNMPSIEFSHVAIGGKNSWRSEKMEKIKKANESDVTTILRLNLPFSLLRLPEGSYELKENQHTYKFVIKRIIRNPEVAKDLTGWTPVGNIDIIADRFGRFSYSRIEIQIPYRIIDVEMWDYFCPNCKLEVDKNTTMCSACSAEFTSEKSRRPPHKKAKIKAIEIINKFLDAYRFFFRDYFIEHIRYDDIISFEIEYKLSDGTKASWQEAFDISYDGSVKTGSLVADEESVKKFRTFLSKPEERMILRDYLLSSSANRISTEEYHLSILEAVIALEISLSDYIMKKMANLQLPKDKNKAFLMYIGAYGNLKVILRLLTKDEPQLSDTIYKECEEAITKRNKIMHEAKTSATYGEAKKILWNTKKMIEYISNLND
jgi:hypothetical protein